MLAQLEALREASIRPNVQIHILRFSDGLYPHWNEPCVLFEFDLPGLGPVLFRESPHYDCIIRESAVEDEPKKYLCSFLKLQQMAPVEDSSKYLTVLLPELA